MLDSLIIVAVIIMNNLVICRCPLLSDMEHAGAERFGNVAVEVKVHILWGNDVNCTVYKYTVVKT